AAGEERIGKLEQLAIPAGFDDEQLPPLGEWDTLTRFDVRPLNEAVEVQTSAISRAPSSNGNGNGNGNGHASKTAVATGNRLADPAPGLASEPTAGSSSEDSIHVGERKDTES